VRFIIDSCYDRARTILTENRDKMEDIVRVLLEKESIEREEFIALMQGAKSPSGEENTPPEAPTATVDTLPSQSDKPNPVRYPNLRAEPGVA
jgi:cell division protease FtsH